MAVDALYEGSYLSINILQSTHGRLRNRENWCKLNLNQTSYDTGAGFPLRVDVVEQRRSSSISNPYYIILDHQTEKTFWISYDDIFSSDDAARDVISKLLFLVDVPFSLDYKLDWGDIVGYYAAVKMSSINMLEKGRDLVISKIVELCRGMKDLACDDDKEDWLMTLRIAKDTYLPDAEFMEMYNNKEEWQNYLVYRRTQRELDSRIAAFQALHKQV